MNLTYVTNEFPGIGGVIKQRPEDFFVQELPLYDASGEGEHVYCEIEKVGLTTFHAIDRVAAALNVGQRDIGYAGMKDSQAVSRQLFSIWGTTPEKVMEMKVQDIRVLWAARHGNKLRLGHLAGNRFGVKIRKVNPTDVIKLTEPVKRLTEKGMPNFFGEQRFGYRQDNDKLGAAILSGDDQRLLDQLLGSPDKAVDDASSIEARRAYERGDFEMAMKLYPRRCGLERRVLARRINTRNARAAASLIDQRLRRLWISALQSSLFNQVVSRRIGALDKLLTGDLAYKEDSGGVFLVTDAAVEQLRADRLEISPTGPLIGYRMTQPQGEALKIEQEVMEANGLKPEDFRAEGRLKVKGARRPMRVRPRDVELLAGVDEHGSYIAAAFTLPPGSFATVFLGELMKKKAADLASESEGADESKVADEAQAMSDAEAEE